MRRRHHFHIEYAGHSVSATVQTGRTPVVEVLVDGKETGHGTTRGDQPVTLDVELPSDPPIKVAVRATPGPGTPGCVLLAAGAEDQVMAPRPF